jgi:hypothetical protein
MFILCIIFIACQCVILYAWDAGALDQSIELYRSFGQQVPEVMAFGQKTAQHWWAAPLSCSFLLLLRLFVRSGSYSIMVPFIISLTVLLFMLYTMYPVPNLVKVGG